MLRVVNLPPISLCLRTGWEKIMNMRNKQTNKRTKQQEKNKTWTGIELSKTANLSIYYPSQLFLLCKWLVLENVYCTCSEYDVEYWCYLYTSESAVKRYVVNVVLWVSESQKTTIKGDEINSQEPFSLAFHLISYNSAGWHEPKWTALARSHVLEKSLIVGGTLKSLWAWFHVLSDQCSDGWRDRSPKAGCTFLNQCCVVLMRTTLIYSIDIRPCNDLMAVNTSHRSPSIIVFQISVATSFPLNIRDKGQIDSWLLLHRRNPQLVLAFAMLVRVNHMVKNSHSKAKDLLLCTIQKALVQSYIYFCIRYTTIKHLYACAKKKKKEGIYSKEININSVSKINPSHPPPPSSFNWG